MCRDAGPFVTGKLIFCHIQTARSHVTSHHITPHHVPHTYITLSHSQVAAGLDVAGLGDVEVQAALRQMLWGEDGSQLMRGGDLFCSDGDLSGASTPRAARRVLSRMSSTASLNSGTTNVAEGGARGGAAAISARSSVADLNALDKMDGAQKTGDADAGVSHEASASGALDEGVLSPARSRPLPPTSGSIHSGELSGGGAHSCLASPFATSHQAGRAANQVTFRAVQLAAVAVGAMEEAFGELSPGSTGATPDSPVGGVAGLLRARRRASIELLAGLPLEGAASEGSLGSGGSLGLNGLVPGRAGIKARMLRKSLSRADLLRMAAADLLKPPSDPVAQVLAKVSR